MVKEKNISGVVLAGGASSRFGGKTKSNMIVGGVTIISRMVGILSEVFDEIILVTNKPEEFQDFRKYKLVEDEYKKMGPLGGIHAAMNVSTNPAIFVFAGDMPFVSGELILKQIAHFKKTDCDVLIPKLDSGDEPLHSIYSLSTLTKLDNFLRTTKKYAIRDFLAMVDVKHFTPELAPSVKRIFTNINTPSDLSQADRVMQESAVKN